MQTVGGCAAMHGCRGMRREECGISLINFDDILDGVMSRWYIINYKSKCCDVWAG